MASRRPCSRDRGISCPARAADLRNSLSRREGGESGPVAGFAALTLELASSQTMTGWPISSRRDAECPVGRKPSRAGRRFVPAMPGACDCSPSESRRLSGSTLPWSSGDCLSDLGYEAHALPPPWTPAGISAGTAAAAPGSRHQFIRPATSQPPSPHSSPGSIQPILRFAPTVPSGIAPGLHPSIGGQNCHLLPAGPPPSTDAHPSGFPTTPHRRLRFGRTWRFRRIPPPRDFQRH